jgi:cytochrome c peroxidase
MRSRPFTITAATAVILYVLVLSSAPAMRAQEPEGNFGVGIPEVFLPKYEAFRAAQLASADPDVMRIDLGYVKGLSTSFVKMTGEATVDLDTGHFEVSLSGLTPLLTYRVWLVDRTEIEGVPPLPDPPDLPFGLVTFVATGPAALLTGLLPVNLLPPGFTLDRIAVTEGVLFGGPTLAAGSVNTFQKIFHRRLSLLNESTGVVLFDETTTPPALFELVPDLAAETDAMAWMGPKLMAPGPSLRFATFSLQPARAAMAMRRTGGPSVKLDKLISQGAELFFVNTFNGNGRTCGTCHPASNNFMIDPAFIGTLPANNPLFVAEFNPALAQLEKPTLMRQFGLILENLDGFDPPPFTPATKFVMRGVPHTLGLQVSLERDTSNPNHPAQMTGWSGDGAPRSGSLRDFAIGAVTQHFTKRLNRVEGTDFTLPKEHQLDAMEVFQLSLGRSTDFDLTKITFTDANVVNGQSLFVNGLNPNGNNGLAGGKCAGCHNNGGALLAGQNRNINTNVEDAVHPARSVQNFPIDGGFGRNNNGDGTFGNRTFNLASVVEAADTAPFFHNNLKSTLEGVLDFYNSDDFNNPRALTAQFDFDQTQREQIADFMRGLNTLQNIDVAQRELQEILDNNSDPQQEQATRLQTAFEETDDAIKVLTDPTNPGGNLFTEAKDRLVEARNLISQAQVTGNSGQKRALIQQAITKLEAARPLVATVAP